jgi:poly [ADP-ribose] polymerase
MARVEKLICVDGKTNHNKIYEMHENADGSWVAKYGRVGSSLATASYPASAWNTKYREKIRKGYTPVTELVSVAKADQGDLVVKAATPAVANLVAFLQKAAKNSVTSNYTVRIADVTTKQVEAAQAIIDQLAPLAQEGFSIEAVNAELISLYKTIPRKMRNVSQYLLHTTDLQTLKHIVGNEQDLLDTMRQQVVQTTSTAPSIEGLTIREATAEEIRDIAKRTDLKVESVGKIFAVSNAATEAAYNRNPIVNEQLYYHGSRTQNWWSILNTGLKIRPANAVATGSMFGDGIYGANKAAKSIGYTSLSGSRWASGSDNKAYLALFSFNTGKVWNVFDKESSYCSWMGKISQSICKKHNYDSVFAAKGKGLYNDEAIVYSNDRVTIKYLIELTK